MRAVGFAVFVATSSVALVASAEDPADRKGWALPIEIAPIQGPESNSAPPHYRSNPRGSGRSRPRKKPATGPPNELIYYPGDDIPPGYRLDSRMYYGPIKAGAAMFAPTYLINLMVAASFHGAADWLYVPGVGLWPYVDEACGTSSDGLRETFCPWLVLHAVTHSVGLGLVVAGMAFRRPILAREAPRVTVLPARIGSGNGVELRGRF